MRRRFVCAGQLALFDEDGAPTPEALPLPPLKPETARLPGKGPRRWLALVVRVCVCLHQRTKGSYWGSCYGPR
jgi:hypothetical protein